MTTTFSGTALSDFSGELLKPGDPAYDRARRIWNGSIDRCPAFIARCRTAADVAAAVRFGRRHDLPIAVRGGGHSIPGYSVVEGGLMVDLQPMNGVVVAPNTRSAHVGAGALWRDFDAAAQQHGLATPGGEISDTGVAGLTLGGGIGWLSRLHGLAADNLRAVELVTAAGDVLSADDDTDSDLLWGLRGGGGNFGIVTRFTFDLHPVAPLWGGLVLYPGAAAGEALRAAVEIGNTAPRELALVAAVVCAPPAPFIPAALVGTPIVGLAAAYFGDIEAGRMLIEPLRQLGAPLADTFAVTSYVELQQMFDAANPPGRQQYMKSDFLGPLPPAGLDGLVSHALTPSSPLNQVLLRRMGGAIRDVPDTDTAFGHRDADHMLLVAASWERPADSPEPHRAWVRDTWAAARPWARGTYVNHLGDEGADRVREAYPPATWNRLRRLKARMDPDNVFALNQNIPPADPASAESGEPR